jgi:hypothetical protein
MEASDVSRITYELVRVMCDRIHMAQEDLTGHLFAKIYDLRNRNRSLKNHMNILYNKYEGAINSNELLLRDNTTNATNTSIIPSGMYTYYVYMYIYTYLSK